MQKRRTAAVRLCSAALAAILLAAPAVPVAAGKGTRGPARQAADPARRNKVSSDLRQSLSDSRDSRRRQSGDSGMVSVVV